MGNNQRSSLKKESNKSGSFFNLMPILGLFFVSGGIIFFLYSYFKITSIVCLQNNQACNGETRAKLDHLLGRSLFFTDFNKTLSQFESYQIKKRLSGELMVNLSKTRRSFFRLDENGLIVRANEQTLDPEIDKKINLLIKNLGNGEIEYGQLKLILDSPTTNEEIFIVELSEDLRALIDANDLEGGTYKLDQILDNLELKEIDLSIKEIDTRFKMPVLKTKYSAI